MTPFVSHLSPIHTGCRGLHMWFEYHSVPSCVALCRYIGRSTVLRCLLRPSSSEHVYKCVQLRATCFSYKNTAFPVYFFFILYYDQQNTNISQIITHLRVSTLSCHPQGACNQYLARLHNISTAAVGNTIYR